MTATPARTPSDEGFRPLLEFNLPADTFDSQWVYCDYLSSYVASIVSHNRADPFMFSNLLSATLNELLEAVYRTRKEAGQFHCRILRSGSIDRISLRVPCGHDEQKFYEAVVRELSASDAEKRYLNMLFSNGTLDRSVGLFELAVSYGARFSTETPEGKFLQLTVDLVLEQETA